MVVAPRAGRHIAAMLRFLTHLFFIVIMTVLTQIGGLAWVFALFFRRKFMMFLAAYVALSVASVWLAPRFGRVPLNCFSQGSLEVQNLMYCAMNRNYVSPELAEVLTQTAREMDRRYPGTKTLVLDTNFPFWEGFPLIPHLSHDDGEKADIAFYYQNESGYLAGATRSPIGYFAFEHGSSDCISTWSTLRWDFDILQPLWHEYDLDIERNRSVLQILSGNERVGKIFIEPHLVQTLNVGHPSIRFQGCRAARHDDHIHFQLR